MAALGESLYEEKKAKEGQEYMLQIAKEHPIERIILCANSLYASTILAFEGAKDDLIRDPWFAAYKARVAGDGPDYCAEAFKEANIENPPINKLGISI
ncbi:unnamed protein product [Lupinus luteus]|uniref:Uncharacterized protein n=1 Tax=Lupinus luteus TaxID=3873 RepID=A0AAV1W1J6_LUPLU